MIDIRHHTFASYLVNKGLVTQPAAEAALMEQRVTGDPVGMILVRNGFLNQKSLIHSLIETKSNKLLTEHFYASHVPGDILFDHKVMLVAETDQEVFVATYGNHAVVRRLLAPYFVGRTIKFLPLHIARLEEYLSNLDRSGPGDNEGQFMDRILALAMAKGVSDVHIIPRYRSYTIMFRQSGVRQIEHEGTIEEYLKLSARIKDRSRMDIAERRVPQDGGFQLESNGKMIDLRVATVPTPDGEYIVIRLLDPDRVEPNLNRIGVTRVEEWRKAVSRPDGLCIVTGPTGSGKTTTLNSTIRELDRFERSIFSVEDPVEYRTPYLGQVNINPVVGLDFARAVRAFMRSDPDVIILGEVRDPETAANAVKAAETGHLVLATLHTNSIRGSLDRLKDLDIPYHEVRYLLRGVLTQRLLRMTCSHCGGKGCAACGDSGYRGRTVVSECAYFKDQEAVNRLIEGHIDWPTMLDDAVGKCIAGQTDAREVIRIFGAEGEASLRACGVDV